jgi:LPXTG-motif cell wall-anchored protein
MATLKFRTLLGALLAVLVLGGATASWAQYPPTVGAGRVTRSTLKQCQCTQFSGDGFKPGTTVTIVDQYPDGSEHVLRTVVADSKGGFKTKVCFDEKAPQGQHRLIARGTDPNGRAHEDTAVVVVKGSVCFQRGDEVHGDRFERGNEGVGGNGNGLPFSGSSSTVPMLLLGFGLVVAGSGVVLVFRRRAYATY